MNSEAFSSLLTTYMRRIRASAAGVASEIGLSREAVNNWRNGTSMPGNRERLRGCARYLRLTEQETNRLFRAAGFEPEFPLQGTSPAGNAAPFAPFMDQIFVRLSQANPYPIALLLSQAHWGQPPFRQELLNRARAIYGDSSVIHIQPPFSVSTASEDYFSAVARQCGFEGVTSDYEFEAALEARLQRGDRLFCLVSRFEQGTSELRETLAGILRSISEMHDGRLHLLLCGGEALADLKYRSGDLSLLNIAQVSYWPELTLADLTLLAEQQWAAAISATTRLDLLLELCGGHPALAEEALQWLCNHPVKEFSTALARLHSQLAMSPRLWQTFLPMIEQEGDRSRLRDWLAADELGRARPYLPDPQLRRLFWNNLICARGEGEAARLVWRCDVIRQAGLQVLES